MVKGRVQVPSEPVVSASGSAGEAEERLETSADGLSQAETERRLGTYGYNKLPEKKTSPILKFLSYFWGPIPGMIMAAAALLGVLRHWPYLAVILSLLVVNAVVGFREEHQAGNIVAALKQKLAIQAKVRRDGDWTSIPARELVPGDIIRVLLAYRVLQREHSGFFGRHVRSDKN